MAAIIVVLTAAVIYQFIMLNKKEHTDDAQTGKTMEKQGLELQVTGMDDAKHRFSLGVPVSVSREALLPPFSKETASSNAFHMPGVNVRTLEFEGQFVGDVNRGGSCNVDILTYIPHGLTHMETSAHILNPGSNPPTIKDIPAEHLGGLVYLMDLTSLDAAPGQKIGWETIKKKLKQVTLPVSMLAIKTKASELPSGFDFSGKDFLSLDAEAARGIHDFPASVHGSVHGSGGQRIDCLILDLPSIDPEKDEGKLAAHRRFFGIPMKGHDAVDGEKRVLVELAWFHGLDEGYYYAVITPPRFQANAVSTGVVFYPLEK